MPSLPGCDAEGAPSQQACTTNTWTPLPRQRPAGPSMPAGCDRLAQVPTTPRPRSGMPTSLGSANWPAAHGRKHRHAQRIVIRNWKEFELQASGVFQVHRDTDGFEQNRPVCAYAAGQRRSFDVSWGDGREIGAGRVVSVRLGEQREKIAALDGQAFIVASE
jgi:hypothetical protein